MVFGQIRMHILAWWFLRIARNTAPPPSVRRYLLERIERRRQEVICEGAAAEKTISTDAALKHVLELKATYDGPDREEYVCELDRFADDFRKTHGPQIPVDQAFAILKELEARFGRVE
jgi:NADH dehydrogenase/NADH:ubiquinone oxidoreductase subunit G